MDIGNQVSKLRPPPQRAAPRARPRLGEVLPAISVLDFVPPASPDHLAVRSAGDIIFCRISGRRLRISDSLPRTGLVSDPLLVCLMLSGQCEISQDGRIASVRAGHYAFSDAARPFTADIAGPFDALFVAFPNDAIIREVGATELITAQTYGVNSVLTTMVASYLKRLAETMPALTEAVFPRLAETAVSLLAIGAIETAKPRRQNSWTRSTTLKRIKSYSLARLQTPKLSPAKVAAEMGISIRYLHALFRDESTTFSNWLWSQRLDACRAKICSPEAAQQSIGALALEFGFSNFSHFSRRFRQAYGISARDLRLQLLQQDDATADGNRP
ncbi:MAG: helix-turn-helix domain-containing protein [Xanthobacteraceae bacterium]|nr:helix-turn-helix domain-containing protein [Xanthobacteraceae bacterium]